MRIEYMIVPGYEGDSWLLTSRLEAVEEAMSDPGRRVYARNGDTDTPEPWREVTDE